MPTAAEFPAALNRQILASLYKLLPPPIPNTTDACAERDQEALAMAAALHPEDAFDAELVSQIVGAQFHAKQCLEEAGDLVDDRPAAQRCRNQAASMMRQMQSGTRLLQRTQAAREKALAEMQPAALRAAGYWFRDVSVQAPEPEPAPDEEEVAPFDQLSPAEQYVIMYPKRAALIRATGGLPSPLTFGPPEPDIVDAVVHGATVVFRRLDQEFSLQPAL